MGLLPEPAAQFSDFLYLPVSLWPPDSCRDSPLLVPWLLCPCLGLELQGDASLSLEPVPERLFLLWALCLSWATSVDSLELSTLWRLLFLQLCAFICCNTRRWESRREAVSLLVTVAAEALKGWRKRILICSHTEQRKKVPLKTVLI